MTRRLAVTAAMAADSLLNGSQTVPRHSPRWRANRAPVRAAGRWPRPPAGSPALPGVGGVWRALRAVRGHAAHPDAGGSDNSEV